MTRLRAFGAFVWDFVIGDDWRLAAGVVVALALTALVAGTSLSAWWILPLAVAMLLGFSVWRAAAADGSSQPGPDQLGAEPSGTSSSHH